MSKSVNPRGASVFERDERVELFIRVLNIANDRENDGEEKEMFVINVPLTGL